MPMRAVCLGVVLIGSATGYQASSARVHGRCASHRCERAVHGPRMPLVRTAEVRRSSSVRMEAFSFDPFDRDVFRILMDAQSEARGLGAPAVGTQHLLLAATLPRRWPDERTAGEVGSRLWEVCA